MAAKKEKKTTRKESKFYIARTVYETKEKIETKVKSYNEKYVKKQLENGREFITELKADPIKRIDDLIDDSKDALKKARSTRMKPIQKKLDTVKKDVREKMEKVNKIYKEVENDAKLIVDDVIEIGKKNLDRIPMKKTMEKKISAGIDSIPEKLHLPSKAEIDNLATGVDGVSKKVEKLKKRYTAA